MLAGRRVQARARTTRATVEGRGGRWCGAWALRRDDDDGNVYGNLLLLFLAYPGDRGFWSLLKWNELVYRSVSEWGAACDPTKKSFATSGNYWYHGLLSPNLNLLGC